MSSRKATAPPPRPVKLGLEMLEARENPSYYWDPVSSSDLSASNPVNWVKDSGGTMVRCSPPEVPTTPTDELVFGAYIPQTYRYGAPPIPAHWATADCILTQASQYTTNGVANFRGIKVLVTYPGEVDLRQSATLQDLKMFGGRIKQNDPVALAQSTPSAGTLSVAQTLSWTKGTINSNAVAGQFNLKPGAVGTIDPGDDNAVTLGDTMTLLSGSSLTIASGTTNITRGEGVTVENNSSFKIAFAPVPNVVRNAPQAVTLRLESPLGSVVPDSIKLHVKSGGTASLGRMTNDPKKRYEFSAPGIYLQNEGVVNVYGGVRATFSGVLRHVHTLAIGFEVIEAGYLANEGSLYIWSSNSPQSGGLILTNGSMVVESGAIFLEAQSPAEIPDGHFTFMTGGDEHLSDSVLLYNSSYIQFNDVNSSISTLNVGGSLRLEDKSALVLNYHEVGLETKVDRVEVGGSATFDDFSLITVHVDALALPPSGNVQYPVEAGTSLTMDGTIEFPPGVAALIDWTVVGKKLKFEVK